MRTSTKRLLLGAGLTALVFGGLAPLARADSHQPPSVVPPFCSSDHTSDGDTAAEGMIVAAATSGADADVTCAYSSTEELASQAAVTSLNAWELTRTVLDANGDPVTTVIEGCSQGNLTDGLQAGSPAPTVRCEFAGGGVITLTVHAAVDENSGLGGASVQAVAGSPGA